MLYCLLYIGQIPLNWLNFKKLLKSLNKLDVNNIEWNSEAEYD